MAEIELIGAPQSNYAWAYRIACAEKGVPYRQVPARPHTPETERSIRSARFQRCATAR
jgi:glutathione S-transferase